MSKEEEVQKSANVPTDVEQPSEQSAEAQENTETAQADKPEEAAPSEVAPTKKETEQEPAAKEPQTNTGKKSARESFIERMRAKKPDLNPDDEESFYSSLGSDYDEYDKMRENTDKMTKMMNENKVGAGLLVAIRDGINPLYWLVENYGDDFKELLSDPDKKKELDDALQKYAEKQTKSKEAKETREKNLNKFFDTMRKKQQENHLQDEDMMDIIEGIFGIADGSLSGDFPEEAVNTYIKGYKADNDIASASEEAEIRGRNTKISEKLKKAAPVAKNIPPTIGGGSGRMKAPSPTAKSNNPWKASYSE